MNFNHLRQAANGEDAELAITRAAIAELFAHLRPPAKEGDGEVWYLVDDAPRWLRHLHQTLFTTPAASTDDVAIWVFDALRIEHPGLQLLLGNGSPRFILPDASS